MALPQPFSLKLQLIAGGIASFGLLAPPPYTVEAVKLLLLACMIVGLIYEIKIGRRPFWKIELADLVKIIIDRVLLLLTIALAALLFSSVV
jgi:hypothetical protein